MTDETNKEWVEDCYQILESALQNIDQVFKRATAYKATTNDYQLIFKMAILRHVAGNK